jgi:hypothetical protein
MSSYCDFAKQRTFIFVPPVSSTPGFTGGSMRGRTLGAAGFLAVSALLSACASAPQPSGNGGGQTVYSGGAPNWRAAPTYGTINLAAGFSPDPFLRSIQAGGANEVDLGGSECSGYIHAAAPDLDLNYDAGQYQLVIYAKSDTDITLIVNDPSGNWFCSDDVSGTNPAITFNNPRSGNYNIWIGTYRPSSSPLPESVLYISEMAPRW